MEAKMIFEEVYEGFYATHSNGHTMARTILRADYFWLTMESDCYVRKCHKCQIYADRIHTSLTSLNVILATWLFLMWGLDVRGLIESKASNHH